MAEVVVIHCVLILLIFLPETKATTVEVTSPVQPVKVDGILAVQCQISNPEMGHIVKILRVTGSHTEELDICNQE